MTALYDLHVHTTNSDGLMSPSDVLHGAASIGGLALTDHSALTWGAEILAAAEAAGARLLFPGTEISTTHEGRKYHVLAYGRELLDPAFGDYAFHPTRVKNEVYAMVVDDLVRSGHGLPPFEDMLAGVPSGSGSAAPPTTSTAAGATGATGGAPRHPTKWMMSKTLIGSYLIEDGMPAERAHTLLHEKYEHFRSRSVDRYLRTTEVVAKVTEIGGVAAIAHPWWECPSGRNTAQQVLADLRDLSRLGLLGLEVSTRHLTVGTEAERRTVASKLGLLPFAGSDFHANGKTSIGQFGVTDQELDAIHQAAAARDVSL